MTPLVIEATYENGVLKPAQPLPLQEHEKVQVTIRTAAARRGAQATAGLIPCRNPELIQRIALEPIEEL